VNDLRKTELGETLTALESRRQSENEEKLDLTKNQAPNQVDAVSGIDDEAKNSEIQNVEKASRHKRRAGVRV